jgi:hypothetical protein
VSSTSDLTGSSAHHRVGEFEERIRTGVQALVELHSKARQDPQCLDGRDIGRETHAQRPFLHAALLDISKRGGRPRYVSPETADLSRSSDVRG